MSDKMLKFVKIGQQTPPKRKINVRKKILTRSMMNLLVKKQKNNPVDVLSVEFLFVRFIAH